jgi:uncharacterized protein YcaQ
MLRRMPARRVRALPHSSHRTDHVPADAARRLFLHAQGMLDDPTAPATPVSLYRLIERMGSVQIDSIRVVERAHHLILAARFDAYRPAMLARLLYEERRLFEHWTHDAAAIPTAYFPHWRPRFEDSRRRIERSAWWRGRMGLEFDAVCAHVRERIEREGPLQTKDFEHDRRGDTGGWWGWTPQKTALEYLWHTGELAIARRVHFQKVYDAMDRVLPEAVRLAAPELEAHVEWACRTALDRLGVATASEIAAFWRAVDLGTARRWCAAAESRGEIAAVEVESMDGRRPQPAFAPLDWRRRLRRVPDPPRRLRVLAPFDPIVRDRKRTRRLLGFEFRFEAFVPASQRRHGYYIMPILEGDRLVGRLDPQPRGDGGVVQARRVWWEPGVRATRARRRGLDDALERLTVCLGGGS